jgi:group I intron endonuclease
MTIARNAPKFCGIYKILNVINGKMYIGSSFNAINRLIAHRRCLLNGKHGNVVLQSAWNKYGPDAFVFKPFYRRDREELLAVEQRWIDAVRPAYNLVIVVDGRVTLTAESCARVSAGLAGRKLSDEHVRKTSEAMKRRMSCPAYRAKMIEVNTGRKLSAEHRAKLRGPRGPRGPNTKARPPMSVETRMKISAALKAKGIVPPWRRKDLCAVE